MSNVQEVENNNVLIATFLELKCDKEGWFYGMGLHGNMAFAPSEMHFHTKWEWLMLVIDKIELLRVGNNVSIRVVYECTNEFFQFTIHDENYVIHVITRSHVQNKLTTIYGAVVEFINSYNKNYGINKK